MVRRGLFNINQRPAGAMQGALLLIAAVAVVRLCFPETFCAVYWPSPIASLCS
jgi:hypothetical protein